MNIILGSSIDELKIGLNVITKTVDEITLVFNKDGLRIDCIDRSHIQLHALHLPELAFDYYQIEEPFKCSVPSQTLLKAVNKTKKDEYVQIRYDDVIKTLIIEIINDATQIHKKYNIRTLDEDFTVKEMPDIDYPVDIEVNAKTIQEAIKDLCLDKMDKLSIETKENNLVIQTISDFEYNNIKIPLDVEVPDQKSAYDLHRIQSITSASPYCEDVRLEFGSDMPVLFTYKAQITGSSIQELLAPRIEDVE